MKRVQSLSMWLTAAVAMTTVTIALFFQNCGKSGFDGVDGSGNINVGSVSPQSANAPFAFDAAFDQISYMSCMGGDSSDAIYTIKAGAYERGGLQVTSTFMSYAASNVKPVYPATSASIEQIKTFLSTTPLNAGATPQLAMRLRGNLNQVWHLGSTESPGIDFIRFLTDPTDDRLMDPIVRNAGYASYFPIAPSGSRMMEAKLKYTTTEGVVGDFRKSLSQQGVLALTYSADATSSLPRRATASDTTTAYGRGYMLNFTLPGAAPYSLAPDNVVSNITEKLLDNSGTGGSWSCGDSLSNYQFKIYRLADKAACPNENIGALSNANYRAVMERVRRHLPAEKWDVNLTLGCAVPKEGECYPSDVASSGVEYTNAACFNGYVPIESYGASIPLKRCAQYVSFCFRN